MRLKEVPLSLQAKETNFHNCSAPFFWVCTLFVMSVEHDFSLCQHCSWAVTTVNNLLLAPRNKLVTGGGSELVYTSTQFYPNYNIRRTNSLVYLFQQRKKQERPVHCLDGKGSEFRRYIIMGIITTQWNWMMERIAGFVLNKSQQKTTCFLLLGNCILKWLTKLLNRHIYIFFK